MKENGIFQPELVGRKEELDELKSHLDGASSGKGSTVFVTGEAGIGKTKLVEEFMKHVTTLDITILSGTAAADLVRPFHIFSEALEDVMDEPLFQEQEYTSFAEIFAVNTSGMLVAKSSPEDEELDADIFAGMLSAVQDFVKDSFDAAGEQRSGLGRLEYGDMKIMIEHGQRLFLTAVFRGMEHADMKNHLRNTVRAIEEKHGGILEAWAGDMEDVREIQDEISSLANARFLVRRDLENINLDNEKVRIADLVLENVLRLSESKPILLYLEDIHWANDSSLFVLNYVARNVREGKVMIVGTLRPEESDVLRKTIENMREEGILIEILLEKLQKEDVASLMDDLYAPNEFPEILAENLVGQCEGNPFFVIEMLRQMELEGNITRQEGVYMLMKEDYAIPDSVEFVVDRRLVTLDMDAMAMAEYSSCIGKEFERTAALSLPISDAPSALEKLVPSGILVTNNGTVAFSHSIFQDVIYNNIGERWKTGYHKNLGTYYESAYKDNLDDVLYELARHFSRSNEHVKAYEYCFRAGEKAEGVFAPEQAMEFYTDALAVLKLKTDMRTEEKEIEIRGRLGDLHWLLGEYEKALKEYDWALQRESETPKVADLHRRIASVYLEKGEFEKGMAECDTGLDIMKDEAVVTSKLLNIKGMLEGAVGEYAKAEDIYSKSLEIAERHSSNNDISRAMNGLGAMKLHVNEFDKANDFFQKVLSITVDEARKSNIYFNIAVMHALMGEYEKALEHNQRSLEIAEKNRNLYNISQCLNSFGMIYNSKGELDKALDYFNQSLTLTQKLGDKLGIATALGNIGLVYMNTGDFEKSLKYNQDCLVIKEEIDNKQGVAITLNDIGYVLYNMGELDSAVEYLEKSIALCEKIGEKVMLGHALVNTGFVHFDKGDLEKALEYYKKSFKVREDIGAKKDLIESYVAISEVSVVLSNLDTAKEYAEKGLDLSREVGAPLEEGTAHRAIGSVHREAKEFDKAAGSYDEARRLLEGLGSERELAKVFYGLALLHKMKGELSEAKENLGKAADMFEKMGMKLWMEKAVGMLNELE